MTSTRTSPAETTRPDADAAAERGSLPGRLTLDRFGASMPVDAPLYQSPPFYFRDARAMTVAYETDADAAADMLPEGLELSLPAVAQLMIVHYPFSTFGPYHEAIMGLSCRWEGEPRFYIAHIAVTTVPPLVAGREVWGFPKKLAHVDLRQEDEFLVGVLERPAGLRLATVSMRIERPLEVSDAAGGGGTLALRVIPGAEAGSPPSLAELIEVPSMDRRTHEAWEGQATVTFDAESTLDPWHRLPVRNVLRVTYSRYDFVLPHGRVLRSY